MDGNSQDKLTEEELSERLAAIKIKNAAREAAHRRAEQDEASFRQREHNDAVKQREERANRREMEGERERNRLRKMKALHGREWDAQKDEADFVEVRGTGKALYRRGLHGGVGGAGARGRGGHGDDVRDGGAGAGAVGPESGNGFGNGRGRGEFIPRGSRGRGGRGGPRGRGRGGHFAGDRAPHPGASTDASVPSVSSEKAFPALPPAAKQDTHSSDAHDASKASNNTARETSQELPRPQNDTPAGKESSHTANETEASAPKDVVPSATDPSSKPAGANGETWADQVEAGTPSVPA